jgi:hypothetical protein
MLFSNSHHPSSVAYRHYVAVQPRRADYFARLALDPQTRKDAYRLRYDSYLTSGFIEPNATGQFQDVYDELPNCQTIVIYDQDKPVASVRTCTFALGFGQQSPAMDTFPEQVTALLSQHVGIGFGGRGIETTRLVRSPSAENNQGLVFLLYRLAGYIGMMAYTQVLFACVRQNHVSFYQRLGYEPVTEPKSYPGLKCPMLLMACSRPRYDEIRSAFPLVDPYAGETETLDGFLLGETIPVSLSRSWQ